MKTAIAAMLVAAGTTLAGDTPTFTPYPGTAQIIDISDDGTRFVSIGFNNSIWINGVETVIGESPIAISGDGSTVIGTVTTPGDGLMYAGRWREGTGWENLGDLGLGGCDFNRSSGYDCNEDGSIVVGLGWEGCKGRAFVYTDDKGMFPLPQTTDNSARANAVSNDGMTVAGWQQGNCRQAAYWTDWNETEILPSPADCGEFYDMLDDGSVIVGENNFEAVYWTPDDGLVGLGFIDQGVGTRAFGISDDGSVIVGQAGDFFNGYKAFMWTEELGMVDLREYLVANGAGNMPLLTWANSVAVTDTEIVITGASGNPPFTEGYVATIPLEGGCYADCDGNGELNILDFVCYQNTFTAGDDAADCDGNGQLNILDFVCFQNEFTAGCN